MFTSQKVSFHSFTISVRTEMRASTVPSVGCSPAIGSAFLAPSAPEALFLEGLSTAVAGAAAGSSRLGDSTFLAVGGMVGVGLGGGGL